jgi:DNA polymerase
MAERNAAVGGDVDSLELAEVRSALAWWLECGVDTVIQEDARDWLKAPEPRKEAPAAAEAPPANIVRPSHETLSELQDWLATSANLPFASATSKRILPVGPAEAAIMLLTDAPTLEDHAAGQPIGGDSWILAQRMLAAIGIKADDAYCASLSCFNAPGVRMNPKEREECAEIARRHIALAKPKRLLLLGDGPAQALLGKPIAQARGHLHKVEGIPAVATFHPRHLIKRPLDKSLAWKDLLLLMETDS